MAKKHSVEVVPTRPEPTVLRPLLGRTREERYEEGSITRLIGLELRIQDPMGCTEELMMIPLNIEIPKTGQMGYQWSFGPHTLHTSAGDVNLGQVGIPSNGL